MSRAEEKLLHFKNNINILHFPHTSHWDSLHFSKSYNFKDTDKNVLSQKWQFPKTKKEYWGL